MLKCFAPKWLTQVYFCQCIAGELSFWAVCTLRLLLLFQCCWKNDKKKKTGTSNLFSSPEAWPFSLCHHFFSVGPGTFKGSGTVYCTLYSILLSPWPSDSNTNFVFSVPSGTCMVGPWLERSLSRLSVATTTRGSALSSRNPILLPHWLEAIDGWKERRHEPIRASETERVTAERTREKGETDAWTLTR